jgi:HemY protein
MLLRLFILLVFLALAALGLAWLADAPGAVTVDWRGWRMDTSLVVLAGGVLFAIAVIFAFVWTVRRIFITPLRYREARGIRRYEQGLAALTESLSAIALKDVDYAKKQAERASRLLKHAPVMHLVSAQLARLEGQDGESRHHLEQLLKNPQTEFAATRGLLENARRKQEWPAMASLGERALHLRPKDRWSVLSLMDAYLHQQRWQDMLGLLERGRRRHSITRDEFKRYNALTHYLHGAALAKSGDDATAENSLQYAWRRLPDFPPAAALLARIQQRRIGAPAGMKTLSKSWPLFPHPDLADAFLDVMRSEKDSTRVMSAANRLVGAVPQHPESLLLLARAAMLAKYPAQARKHLVTLTERTPNKRAYRLLSEIDQASGNPEAASEWQSKAALCERDYSWRCGVCDYRADEWAVHCPSCGHFDSFHWDQAGEPATALP